MPILSFLLILIFALCTAAQSPIASRLFDDATSLANAGDFEKALRSYKIALNFADTEDANRRARIHFNIGVCHYRLKQHNEAVAELKKAKRLRPDYAKAHYVLGMAETARGNWPDARKAFDSAIGLNGSDGEAWFELGFAYIAEQRYKDAEIAFRNSIRYRSVDSALSHNNIGVILAMRNEFAAAEKEFETALAESGGLIEARKNLEYCRSQNRTELIARMYFAERNTGE